ncbi:MAG: energy transducer TonB [Flavobacterium sp.]|jgi:periplasmic protein TonB|nr:energy transducer TonB [Flavobacterium sp.]MDP5027414.1 energy transducer TonB [Flavobacterium sp.]
MKKILFILLFVASNVFGQNTTEVVITRDYATDIESEEIPFVVIEQVPLFEECKTIPKEKQRDCFQEMMSKFIQKNFYYPEEAQENKIQGRVFIRFVIEKDGTIGEITARGPKDGKIIEEAAINMIKKMPKLIPGKQRGKTVRVSYSVPIIFKLQ